MFFFKKIRVDIQPNKIEYLQIEPDLWRIEKDFKCDINNKNEYFKYSITNGYTTNFRSGPTLLNKVIPKIGKNNLAICWIIHDINYEGYTSRLRADKLLYYMLQNANISEYKCQTIYIGLRSLGGFHYKNTKNNPAIQFDYSVKNKIYDFFKVKNIISTREEHEEELTFSSENKVKVTEELLKLSKEGQIFNNTNIEKFYR